MTNSSTVKTDVICTKLGNLLDILSWTINCWNLYYLMHWFLAVSHLANSIYPRQHILLENVSQTCGPVVIT